jgi:hypothetical protein
MEEMHRLVDEDLVSAAEDERCSVQCSFFRRVAAADQAPMRSDKTSKMRRQRGGSRRPGTGSRARGVATRVVFSGESFLTRLNIPFFLHLHPDTSDR